MIPRRRGFDNTTNVNIVLSRANVATRFPSGAGVHWSAKRVRGIGMSTVRVVSFNALRQRLAAVLGVQSPLFEQFARALESRDEADLQQAIEALEACPDTLRESVQTVLVEWLFDAEDASGLLDLPAATAAVH
jgi:hypothetical protein